MLYLIDSRDRDTGALTTLDLQARSKQTVVAEDPKADAGGVLHASDGEDRSRPSRSPTSARTGSSRTRPSRPTFDQLRKVADGDVTVASRTLDDKQWIVAFLMDNGPVRYYLYDRDASKAHFLFTNRKALEGLPLQKMHPRVIKARDGLELVSYLTLPPGHGRGRRRAGRRKPVPMVLLRPRRTVGPRHLGLQPASHQFLANRGYAVLSVNFRGSTGFGKKFVNAGNKEWAGKMHDDLIDAVDWAVEGEDRRPGQGRHHGRQLRRLRHAGRPDLHPGPVRLRRGHRRPVQPADPAQARSRRTGPRWCSCSRTASATRPPTRARNCSTTARRLTYVDRIKRPLLIGQGANDPRVKQAESDQIVKAMQEHKIPVTYVLFPDEGHGFARPANNLAFYAVTEAFLARNLGGRYEAIGDAFAGSSVTVPTGAAEVPGLAEKVK